MSAALAPSTEPAALPDAAALRALLRSALEVEHVAVTGSTSSDLAERARVAAPVRGVLRWADHQTAGRGRHGRAWLDEAGDALLFSVALPWSRRPEASAAVALACAVGLAHCLREHGAPVRLKWPNDLLLGERKLAGLLAEMVEDRQGARTLVIGVGLNLALGVAQQARLDQPAAALADCVAPGSVHAQRTTWLARLADALVDAARLHAVQGFGPFQARFDALFAWRGEAVRLVAVDGSVTEGRALGVDGDGHLLLQTANTVRAVAQGDLSLRRAEE
jgi:BirA family transcriptional regulator, biotin operon repressor / biotin---[acetyl-CoA-carboxylase] ligase